MSANQENNIWLKQLAKGEDKAYEQLFKQYYKPLVLFADSYINDTELAKDTVQDIFLSLFCNKEIFTTIDKLKSYLYTAIKNKCLKHIRHAKVKDKYASHINISEEEDDDFWNKVLEEEIYFHLLQAVEKLPPKTKDVYLLSLKGFKNKEIAENLDISIETVKSHKRTGKQLLNTQLKGLMSIFWFIGI